MATSQQRGGGGGGATRSKIIVGVGVLMLLLIVAGSRGVGVAQSAPSGVGGASHLSGEIERLTAERDAALAKALQARREAAAAKKAAASGGGPAANGAARKATPDDEEPTDADLLGGKRGSGGAADIKPEFVAGGATGELPSDLTSLGKRDLPPRDTPLSAKPLRAKPNSGAKAHASCRYVFDRYEPSPWEAKYYENINEYQKHVCETMNSEFKDLAAKYKRELPKCTVNKITDDRSPPPSKCDRPANPVGFDESVFSKMHYKLMCDGSERAKQVSKGMPETQVSYIEPLVGMLRHPMFCYKQWGGHNNLFSKNYMVHDEWTVKRNYPFIDAADTTGRGAKPRVFLFDAGGSIWSDGESQAWFHHQYQKWCLDIDGGYFIWETTNHDPRKVMNVVPGHVKPFYHWFNSFTNANPGSWDNPLNQMLRHVEPEDYVVFKLDIDKYEIERPLIDAILDNRELYERVDEFYFEHHVTVEPMMAWWGTSASKDEFQNSSMLMFTEMRKKGIRAHSWV